MAEAKTGKKWETGGQPPGKGGEAKKEKAEEVGGRGYIMEIRGACGHLLYVDSDWSWARCPIDGIITYAW